MKQTLSVLTYHRVMDPRLATGCDPSLVSATPEGFEAQMRHLAARYNVVSADEVADAWSGGAPLPPRAVLITFDDATRDFAEVAWPILKRWKLPATVFVPTAYPGRRERAFWWDRLHCAMAMTTRTAIWAGDLGLLRLDSESYRRASLKRIQRWLKSAPHAEAMEMAERLCRDLGESTPPEGDVLSWSMLRRLARDGVWLGAHTHTHPALTQVSPVEAAEQIRRSREMIAENTGYMPRAFAYPFGDHNDAVVEAARDAGFGFAVTCIDGHNRVGDDPLRLRRTNITRRSTPAVFSLRLTALGARLDQWRHGWSSRPSHVARHAPAPADLTEAPQRLKIGYMMSRFPKVSETFVMNEILAVEARGVPVEIYPLMRERQRTMHPGVADWVRRAHFRSWWSPELLRANAHFLLRKPATYLGVAWQVLRGNFGSRKMFLGALGTFPKAVCFARDMRRDGITHVHAHFATHPALGAYVIHRLTGLPYSFTAHGSDLHVDRRMLDVKVASSAFAVTISEFNKDIIVRECGEAMRGKVHVVRCGVNAEHFKPRSYARADGPFRLVCVASLETVKGHTFLIEACRLLAERGIDFRCDLIGDGPSRRDVEAQVIASGLEGHVHLLGPQPRPAVISYLREADVAVLASHPTKEGKREGIPVALMEAMASGLPVVSTQISGIPELVETGVSGLLVRSGDPVALADALERLYLDAPLRERMGRAGREKVKREFDLDANAGQLLRLVSRRAAAPLAFRTKQSLASVATR
jgi:glycosyltransferase involved in cell wall biosynthesis/peptidoglycan/xylan/chitin deacetylase (PgdA/CDA1 family)